MNATTNVRNTKGSAIFMACVMSLFFLMFLIGYIQDVRLARRAATWPQIDGTVRSSQAVRGCGKGGRSYYPNVEYLYNVDGRSLVGHRIAVLGCNCGSQTSAEATASQYPAGSAVTVYYDPENPAKSALKVNDTVPGIWGIVPLLGLAILYITIAWKYVRDDRAVRRVQQQGTHG